MMTNRNDMLFRKRLAEGLVSDKNREINSIITAEGFPRINSAAFTSPEDAINDEILITCAWNNIIKVYDQKCTTEGE